MRVKLGGSITLTEEKIKQYAVLSGDYNQIHLNQKAAKSYGFKVPISHGMLTMGLALEIVSTFIEKGMTISTYEMQFLNPVFQNNTIQLVGKKIDLEKGSIMLVIEGRNENQVVVKGKIILIRVLK